MERFSLPPVPSYLTPLPPAPSLDSLAPLPSPLADWSTLRPLPCLNGITSNVLPKDLRKIGHRLGETPCLPNTFRAQNKTKSPLEEFFWNLRGYNAELERSGNAAELIFVDDTESGEDENTASRPGMSQVKNVSMGQTANMWFLTQRGETNTRRVHAHLMRQAKTDGPGGMAYEARFAMRNGKWKRGLSDRSILPSLPTTEDTACNLQTVGQAKRDPNLGAIVCSESPDSSPMSICSTVETPILLTEVPAPSNQPLASTILPVLHDNSKSSDITPNLTPSPSPQSQTMVSSRLTSIISPRDEVMQIVEENFKPLGIQTNFSINSPLSSICSTPRAQCLPDPVQDCSLVTPITPISPSLLNAPPPSSLQLDLFGPGVTSPSSLREDSPIPGLFDTSPEVEYELNVHEEDIPHPEMGVFLDRRSDSPSDLSEGEAELLAPPMEYYSASRASRKAKSPLNSLFDGDLSDEEAVSTMDSVYSEPLAATPPLSPLSTRPMVRSPSLQQTRGGNVQQLPTPSSPSPSPMFTKEPYWFSGPRPLFALQKPRIQYSHAQRGQYLASVSSRLSSRRSTRTSTHFDFTWIEGSVDGLTQFLGSQLALEKDEERVLAQKDLKMIAQNTAWAMHVAKG